MRKLISGVAAAIAAMAASPAMACGYTSCATSCFSYSPCVQPAYVAPVAAFSYGYGCGSGCGGWTAARLADPAAQYYYVNQGPTFSGPGAWAPQPTYYAPSVSGWSSYSRPYDYGYVARPRYWGPRAYGYRPYAYRYGGSYYGQRVLRRYY